MYVDLPESTLREYASSQVEPTDFDEFWTRTLASARINPIGVTVDLVDSGLTEIDVFDVSFAGYGGNPVRAWLRVPSRHTGPLPTLVEYVGYGCGRGSAMASLRYAASGFAHLQMDNRGQGAMWSEGDTADDFGSAPHVAGFLTQGIENPETYYYRRLITDAVRAIDAASAIDQIDSDRLGIFGTSQGGGLALAVAGLDPRVKALNARVPFLCDFPRATTITDAQPYAEVSRYLSIHRQKTETVQRTLSYVDGVNFSSRARVPALFSTGLMDPVCPPSTVFGAYNRYAGEKQITVWQHNGHEGGLEDDATLGLELMHRVLRS